MDALRSSLRSVPVPAPPSRRALSDAGLFAPGANLVAAAVAQAVAFNALDTLRVRWQVAPLSTPGGIAAFALRVVRREGLWAGLWRPGLGASAGGALAASVAAALWLPSARASLATEDGDGAGWASLRAGLACAAAASFAAAPLALMKTRAQAAAAVGPGPLAYRRDLGATTVVGWWRGASASALRSAGVGTGRVLGYGASRRFLEGQGLRDGVLRVGTAGGAAFWAATLGAPFDVLATRFMALRPGQTAEDVAELMRAGESLTKVAADVHRDLGARAFLRGWAPQFARLFGYFLACGVAHDALRDAALAPNDGPR